ncbi:methionyl-tRNA formyltransferase [Crassaminicella thermophila]|uniref:Methionyl-tRNA formyltransferase n=1 Tax=Crassaminicella thermophila TaxID=2599308 RepID=A0A5C0SE00_CRATE|nr:methionyl-tRNA formyltransferase [Crassaminicella thermophila]QEK11997.1 methionyl-tRNA formyltransferase [Crassaminicella thermophila]
MKIVFMGTPDFAVPCLNEIVSKGHDVLAVVTQPDRPKGRGKKLTPPPVKEKALEYNIPVLQPENVKEESVILEIEKLAPDCIVVVAFGQILPKKILDIPPYGCINVHASLLPKYRGAAPINWAIINGEKISGVTTMYMDEGLDTGDMILKKEIPIGDKTAGEFHDQLALAGAEILGETLKLIEEEQAPRIKQVDYESSYAPIMDKNTGKIDWKNSAESIYNLIRGVNPWPTAFTFYKGEKFKIWKAKVSKECCNEEPGKIIKVDKDGLFVCTANGVLIIEEIQFPNSKRMTVDAYLRGHKIENNIILGE